MESVTRNVRDIERGDRVALEHVIGAPLAENQQVVIQIVNAEILAADQNRPVDGNGTDQLPEWCSIYEGLSDAEIADIESSIVRSNDSRAIQ